MFAIGKFFFFFFLLLHVLYIHNDETLKHITFTSYGRERKREHMFQEVFHCCEEERDVKDLKGVLMKKETKTKRLKEREKNP